MDTLNYNDIRKSMKSGDALLWRSNNNSIVGFQIREFTGHNVNHASLVVDINEYDRKFQLEALATGITLTSISESILSLGMDKGGKVYWLPLKNIYNVLRKKINKIAFDYIGKKYDYRSLFIQAFKRVYPDDKRLFCSEFNYFVWLKAGMAKIESEYAPRPGDIFNFDIFEGRYLLK